MYKLTLLLAVILFSVPLKAQNIDSIYVHLYTDSLKKGTYNYINIDGRLSNGKYLPLDSTQVLFSASYGTFYGNSLWIEAGCREEKITIKAVLRADPRLQREFIVYVKKTGDDQRLKTEAEIMKEMREAKNKKQ